jgi:hypothetical protein
VRRLERLLTKQQNNPSPQQLSEQQYESNDKAERAAEKRPFVEPSVSVPADVLEATALFQAPTIQTSVVP